MMRKEMNINEKEGVQRSSVETMDNMENEEEENEEEMRVEKPKGSTPLEKNQRKRRGDCKMTFCRKVGKRTTL
ncbi:hypothetical protein MRB53_024718 [Persea americana]|uniref:Uncharacterized protein n=1 Tax=Persea americana TaxID=3435 RepID=A0ACC2LD66_PERAE|nr:hypothetical protein MRB53_024718 [Persea americana]